jgi:Holliday junction resolvase RusA-like endonuclease
MNDWFTLTYEGPFVPYTRMTQRSKWTRRSQRYLKSQHAMRRVFAQQWGNRPPLSKQPFRVVILIEMKKGKHRGLHRQDLDNQAKAIIDAAQSVVFVDDRWMDWQTQRRKIGEVDRVVLSVKPL